MVSVVFLFVFDKYIYSYIPIYITDHFTPLFTWGIILYVGTQNSMSLWRPQTGVSLWRLQTGRCTPLDKGTNISTVWWFLLYDWVLKYVHADTFHQIYTPSSLGPFLHPSLSPSLLHPPSLPPPPSFIPPPPLHPFLSPPSFILPSPLPFSPPSLLSLPYTSNVREHMVTTYNNIYIIRASQAYLPLWLTEEAVENIDTGVRITWEGCLGGVKLWQCHLAQLCGCLEQHA